MKMDFHLLKRYFSGECSQRERQYVSAWLSEEKNKREAMELMEGFWMEHVAAEQEPKKLNLRMPRALLRLAAAAAMVLMGITIVLVATRKSKDTVLPDQEFLVQGHVLNEGTERQGINDLKLTDTLETATDLVGKIAGTNDEANKKKVVQDPQVAKPVQSSILQKAKLVNEKQFLDLLASLDSTQMTALFTHRNSYLKDIVSDIREKYNLQISVCDERMNSLVVNKDFDAVNLRELLFQIRKEMDLTFSVQNNQILICFNSKDK